MRVRSFDTALAVTTMIAASLGAVCTHGEPRACVCRDRQSGLEMRSRTGPTVATRTGGWVTSADPRGIGAQPRGGGEACAVVTYLGQDTGGQDGPEAGDSLQQLGVGVLLELVGHGLFEVADAGLHGDDDPEQGAGGAAVRELGAGGQAKRRCAQLRTDLLDLGGVVAATAAL